MQLVFCHWAKTTVSPNSESWCLENTYIQTICTVRCFLTNVFRWWKKHSEGFCCWQGDWPCTSCSPSQSRYTWVSFGSVFWNATSLIYTVERMVTVKVSWASFCRVHSEADQWQPESGRKQHLCGYWYRPSCTVWYKACCDGISPQRLWVHSRVLVTLVQYLYNVMSLTGTSNDYIHCN